MTLRLSSGNKRDGTPNLQNIPSDEETRSCFICEEGTIMIDADYSSQEQVILANFSQEENLINFYAKGFKDMHSYVAFLMYPAIRECTIEELTPEKLYYIPEKHGSKRKLAKNAGFAINYGGNGATIAKNCNIPRAEGDFVYTSYFKSFPGLKNYFELKFNQTSKSGYITFNNVTKRKLFYDLSTNEYFVHNLDIQDPYFWQNEPNAKQINTKYNTCKSEIQRKSQNYPIQGSAADVTKLATVYFFKEILKNNWFGIVKIVNIVHDELLIECPIELKNEVDVILINCMEKAGEPFCPIVSLKADSKSGDHWVH